MIRELVYTEHFVEEATDCYALSVAENASERHSRKTTELEKDIAIVLDQILTVARAGLYVFSS